MCDDEDVDLPGLVASGMVLFVGTKKISPGMVISIPGEIINGSSIGKPTAPTIKPPIARRRHWLTGSDGLTMMLHIGGKRLGHVKRADGEGWQWHCGLPGIARNDMHGRTDELPEARAAVERVCLKWFEDVDREIVQ